MTPLGWLGCKTSTQTFCSEIQDRGGGEGGLFFQNYCASLVQLRYKIGGGWMVRKCVSCLRGVQLILAYSWARPAILVAGKGRDGIFLFLLFLQFHSCSSFFPVPLFLRYLFYCLLSLFSLSLGDNTKWPTRVDMLLNPNTIKSAIKCFRPASIHLSITLSPTLL